MPPTLPLPGCGGAVSKAANTKKPGCGGGRLPPHTRARVGAVGGAGAAALGGRWPQIFGDFCRRRWPVFYMYFDSGAFHARPTLYYILFISPTGRWPVEDGEWWQRRRWVAAAQHTPTSSTTNYINRPNNKIQNTTHIVHTYSTHSRNKM